MPSGWRRPMAPLRHASRRLACLLSGGDRKLPSDGQNDAIDPHATFAETANWWSILTQQKAFSLQAVKTAPPARAVTLVPGKYAREMTLVDEAAKQGNIGEFAAGVF